MTATEQHTNKITVRDLTDDEIAEFRREGFVHLSGFVDPATVERLLTDADDQMAAPPGPYTTNMTTDGVFFQDRDMYHNRPAFNDYVMASNVAEQAGRAMGSQQVRFYFDHLFALDPNTAKDEYYWHQDQPYWGAFGNEICSFWLALTDCRDDSGALEFVRGTDRGPLYLPVEFGDATDTVDTKRAEGKWPTKEERQPAYHEHPDDYEIVTFEVKAGDAILFNTKIMHSSRGNHSPDQRRVAYSTRWFGDDITFQEKPGFQDPVTYPEEGFPVGENMAKATKFPLRWTADA
ncbi:MAG: phytanoyl-CoA dioxygenase family protein [Acidimicrobiales bacterium]